MRSGTVPLGHEPMKQPLKSWMFKDVGASVLFILAVAACWATPRKRGPSQSMRALGGDVDAHGSLGHLPMSHATLFEGWFALLHRGCLQYSRSAVAASRLAPWLEVDVHMSEVLRAAGKNTAEHGATPSRDSSALKLRWGTQKLDPKERTRKHP